MEQEDKIIRLRPRVELSEEEQQQVERLRKRKKSRKWIIAGTALGLALMVAITLYIYERSTIYTTLSVENSYEIKGVSESQFKNWMGGFIKYGRDGVALLSYTGEEQWNYGYQIMNPMIETTPTSIAIADKGANTIVVLDEQGIKGELETQFPIEKIAVSYQGVVAALVRGEDTSKVMCYDAVGNLLVEHSVSTSGMGYPVEVAISSDGNKIGVVYLQTINGKIESEFVCYDLNAEGASGVTETSVSLDGKLIPSVQFISGQEVVLVTDRGFMIYSMADEMELLQEVEYEDEIKSLVWTEEFLAFVLDSSENEENQIDVYGWSGNLVLSQSFQGEYSNISIEEDEIIMYDKYSCKVITLYGKEKYSGELPEETFGMYAVSGLNKYITIGIDSIEEIRMKR